MMMETISKVFDMQFHAHRLGYWQQMIYEDPLMTYAESSLPSPPEEDNSGEYPQIKV